MKRLTPEQILAWAQPGQASEPVSQLSHIDWTRPFVPEEFTQLYFTPVYRELTRSQRLRYNQLFGLRINEQFQVFESGFTSRIMHRLLQHERVRERPALRQCMVSLVEDEARHDRMFRRLNRLAAPQLYARGDCHFTRMGGVRKAGLWLLSRATSKLVFLVWFILIMEEYSNALSRATLREGPPGELGAVEPGFQAVHRAHLDDELRHVHVDANLIDVLLTEMSPAGRSGSARWFHWFVREALTPKHVGKRVVDRLLHDCPELRSRRPRLHRALAALDFDPVMASVLHDASRSPLTHALAEAYPEFRLGMQPPPAASGAATSAGG